MSKVGPSGPRNAKIAIVGMGPARDEVATGKPFTGPAGQILDKALAANGLSRRDVYVTNIYDQYLQPGTSLFSLPPDVIRWSTDRLKRELMDVRPNVVMPLGDEPLTIICGLSSITKWRGSILESKLIPGLKCVPSVHTAWILRGMWKWFSLFAHVDLKRVIEESKSPDFNYPVRDAITGPGLSTVLDFIEECNEHEDLGLDIEGTREITCCGIGYTPNQALCIPFVRGDGSPYWALSDEARIWKALAGLLQNVNVRKYGHRLAYEWIKFWERSIYPTNMYVDTHLLHHTLYPDFGETEDVFGKRKKQWDEPGHSLALITSQYTRSPYYKDDGRKWEPRMGDHQFWKYNCMDVMIPLEAGPKMVAEAKEEGLWDIYLEYKVRPFYHARRMEWFGVAIDPDKRALASQELGREIGILQDRINQKLGKNLNVNSSKQMLALLYNEMGFKPILNRLTKRPTADKNALFEIAERTQNEVLLWIQELRSKIDLKSDVIDQELGADGRMHTQYGHTDTHRWTSSESIMGTGTNLQNIPVKGVARQLFVPD
jgi:uracil-DNA glycosylase family 4